MRCTVVYSCVGSTECAGILGRLWPLERQRVDIHRRGEQYPSAFNGTPGGEGYGADESKADRFYV
jgi:hypothetical protein